MHTSPSLDAQSDSTSRISSQENLKVHTPPELPYSLYTRKRSIALIWSALITITCIQIEFLYFLLRYGTSISLGIALIVPTALLLSFSILAMLFRTWQLARRGSKLRPTGGKWYSVYLQ